MLERLTMLLVALGLTLTGAMARAESYDNREFGVHFEQPGDWAVIDRAFLQRIRQAPELPLPGIDPRLIATIRAQVEAGTMIAFYKRTAADGGFADNVNLVRLDRQVVVNQEFTNQYCAQIVEQYPVWFRRVIRFQSCAMVELPDTSAVRSVSDGASPGTKMLQYLIPAPHGRQYLLTATAKEGRETALFRDVDDLVKLLKMLDPQG